MERVRSITAPIAVMLFLLGAMFWLALPVSAQLPSDLVQPVEEDTEPALEADTAVERAASGPTLLITDNRGRLGRVTVASTAVVSPLGSTGKILTDIARCPSNGRLFGITFTDLYFITTNPVRLTALGRHGIPGGNALLCRSDGRLLGAGFQSKSLWRITLKNGSSGPTGIAERKELKPSIGFYSDGDLAFYGGNLFMVSLDDHLLSIRLGTNDSIISTQDKGQLHYLRGQTPIRIAQAYGLVSASNGVLYAVARNQIFSVNTSNALCTLKTTYQHPSLSNAYGATQ